MSLLSQPFATPSRVKGVFRYLLRARKQRESREGLEAIVSPTALLRRVAEQDHDAPESADRGMVRASVEEGVKLKLFVLDDAEVAINPALPGVARARETAEELLPWTIANLIFRTDNEENHDLALWLSWYLAQDVHDAPKDFDEFEAAVKSQHRQAQLGPNTTNYGQFVDWSCFLGLAWSHAKERKTKDKRTERKAVHTPDPTAFLQAHLDALFEGTPGALDLADFMDRLSRLCPVLDGGEFSRRIDKRTLGEREQQLSSVSACALLRLEYERRIELKKESDARVVYQLPDGPTARRECSRIALLAPERKG